MSDTFRRVQTFLAAREVRAFVVGGAVRDRMLGVEVNVTGDLDLSVDVPAREIADGLAEAIGATAVVIDARRGHVRLVPRRPEARDSAGPSHVDLSSDGGEIERDLARRDFSINAMAIPLDDWVADREGDPRTSLVDPFGGSHDVSRRVLRETRPGSLAADPVRLLRAVRIAMQFDLSIDPVTAGAVSDNADLLNEVAGERVREEFFTLVGLPRAADAIHELDRLRLLDVLLPELTRGRGVEQPREHHYYDVMEHQVRALDMATRLLDPAQRAVDPAFRWIPWRPESAASPGFPPFDEYFSELIGDGQTRGTLLRTAALLHDIGKPGSRTFEPPSPGHPEGRTRFFGHDRLGAEMVSAVLGRMRCGRRTVAHVSRMVEEHLRPSQMSVPGKKPTDRAIFRYIRDVSPVAIDTVLLNLCDYLAARGPLLEDAECASYSEMLGDILSRGLQGLEPGPEPPERGLLLNGHQVQRRFGLSPGPDIGRLLDALRESESTGAVRTRAEAYELLARLLGRAASRREGT